MVSPENSCFVKRGIASPQGTDTDRGKAANGKPFGAVLLSHDEQVLVYEAWDAGEPSGDMPLPTNTA